MKQTPDKIRDIKRVELTEEEKSYIFSRVVFPQIDIREFVEIPARNDKDEVLGK